MVENAVLQQAVARKTLEMEAQSHRLEESEQRFMEAFEHAPIGIALVLPDGRWLKVNRALCELVGYSEAELLDRSFQDITHPEDLDLDMEVLHRMVGGEIRTYQLEKRYIHADGHFVPVSLNVSLARDNDGEPRYFIAHIQDVSPRKQAEQHHRMEEERTLRQRSALIAFTSESGIGGDLTATIRNLTETDARTLGVARVSVWRYNATRTAIRCVDLYELEADRHSAGIELPAEAYPAYFEALKGMDVIAAEDAHSDPRTSEFSEGYLRPLGINSMLDAPIHLGGGEEGVLCHEHVGPPRRWTADEETFAVAVANRISLALEASEHQRVADELRRALAQIEQMLAHNPGVIFRLKVEGDRLVPLALSDNIKTLLGYTIAEAADPGWWADHLHPEDREKAFAGMEELFRQGTLRSEYRFLNKEGEYRWIEDNQRLLRDASGAPVETVGVWMDITERRETEVRLERVNRELLEVSRRAGMAEVATSVLHNVGNVLNSVNISCSVIAQKVGKSRIGSVAKTATLLREHAGDLPGFLTTNPVGQKLPQFLAKLADRLSQDQTEILEELEALDRNIDHIKVIVGMQQNYARIAGVTEIANMTDLVESALRLNEDSLTRHDVKVVRQYSDVPPTEVEKHKVLQILVNLLQNAKHACEDSGRPDKQVTVAVSADEEQVRIAVIDNGVGIPAENLTRIFAHGFTTKATGHGFGLHGCAVAAGEMNGRLTATSDGPGTGATFTLELPIAEEPVPEPNP
jgi:PAS domain S-box-containing protein